MKIQNNNAFKYAPKTFYNGTKKYIFYQFFDNSTLILAQKNSIKSTKTSNSSYI